MLLQPFFRLHIPRHLNLDDVPEASRVVLFQQMSQFMNNDVIDDEHRRLDELPVEIKAIAGGA